MRNNEKSKLHPKLAVQTMEGELRNCHFAVSKTGKVVWYRRKCSWEKFLICISVSLSGFTESLTSSVCSLEHSGMHWQ